MALSPVGVSRISLFKAASLDFNGSNWVSSSRALAPPSSDPTRLVVLKSAAPCKHIACSAVQESSTPTVSADAKEEKAEAIPAAAKPKPAAKAPAKALPQMMEEDVIPALKSILEAQDDITDLELAFKDNTLEGSFLQKDKAYSFWAFFPDGNLTGPKGFSLCSYGSEVSTVEPFLIDEKKITPRHVVFWVEKRLAAQGIIPVWER
ncbi:hypothetical protein BVRB_5g119180 [Beta vulgaris subsp. vulgaris]|uniref:uncharacterized protein LOC104894488 n=1 Tax=Beta vulgaris subsp. vulgaris TaxID=3555 RepID=UPI00053FA759|nr:uncharacterized protein LOC104894488 [Beta vulgaris subsp. vulgaris]KMT10157.1 hypothetical protein BVRB_5g119180 [Beta vulgaris subsp. vulgaris]